MSLLEVKQRSNEWFAARKGRVTGSVVGAVLGVSPNLTPKQLMRRLVRDWHGVESEFKGNIATEYGTLHEPLAMLDYTNKTGNAIHEVGFLEKGEWLGASPDGIIIDEYGYPIVLEVKCPFGLRNDIPPQFKTALEQPHYYAQMQIEMFCAESEKCHFYQWSQHGDSLEIVEYNHKWIAENLPKLKAFHDKFLQELDNPAHLEPAVPEIDTARASILLSAYDMACSSIDTANAAKVEIIEELAQIAKGQTSLICGRKFTKVKKQGAISYAKAIKDLLPEADLSKYQGKESEYWKLS